MSLSSFGVGNPKWANLIPFHYNHNDVKVRDGLDYRTAVEWGRETGGKGKGPSTQFLSHLGLYKDCPSGILHPQDLKGILGMTVALNSFTLCRSILCMNHHCLLPFRDSSA